MVTDTLSFISKSNEVHDFSYDYSKSVYTRSKDPIIITCPSHGDFYQIPYNHLLGKGCRMCGIKKCSKSKAIKFEEFLKRSMETHGDKYKYMEDKFDSKYVTIICEKHGEFKQKVSSHLKGHGCKKCSLYKHKDIDKLFKEIHEDKYDYSKFIFSKRSTKSTIICKKHGEFLQSFDSHISGHGCPSCSGNIFITKEYFIEMSIKTHGDRYDYSKSNIVNSTTKTTITCKEHGDFKQVPTSHYIKGHGCPKCNLSKGEILIENFLIKNNIKYKTQHKIPECKNINPLPFDFLICDHNLLIEYDGEQHFKVDGLLNKTEEDLLIRQLCDSIKNEFCLNSEIKLLRIPYFKFDELEDILLEFFKENNVLL